MTHLLLLLALYADADDLRAAADKTAGQPGLSFTVKDGPGIPLTGSWQKGRPLSATSDGIPFLRKGEVLIYKDAGKWQRTRTGTLSDPLRILGASARVRNLTPPPEELARLAKEAKDAKKEKDGYTVTLGEEASRAWVPPSERGVAKGGTVRVWVADGLVTKYEVKVRLMGRRGGAEIDGEASRTVDLRDIGKAKVEVPAEAAKLLE